MGVSASCGSTIDDGGTATRSGTSSYAGADNGHGATTENGSPLDGSDLQPDKTRVVFKTQTGETVMIAEVADSEPEKSLGLMGRTELAADSGMIFVWSSPTRGGFWMKDTLIPLSIAFVGDDGTIIDILDMEPESLESHAPGKAYMYAIEVNQGYFQENGIRTGDQVLLGVID